MMLNKLEIFPSWLVEYYGIKTKTTYIKFELKKVEEPSAKEPDDKARNEPRLKKMNFNIKKSSR